MYVWALSERWVDDGLGDANKNGVVNVAQNEATGYITENWNIHWSTFTNLKDKNSIEWRSYSGFNEYSPFGFFILFYHLVVNTQMLFLQKYFLKVISF